MLQLRAIFILLGLCVWAEAAYGQNVQNVQDEEADPLPQGRIFSIVRDTEPSRYPSYDSKPIIITSPPQSSYPHPPFYPPAHPPVNYPQPIPYPVHYPRPYPQTIIKPIVYKPYPVHGHHHHGHHGHHHHYTSGGSFSNFPPFFNITYSPAAAVGLRGQIPEEVQTNDINQLIQLLSAQAQTQQQFRPQVQQIQQLPQVQLQQFQQLPQVQQIQLTQLPQYQVQSQAVPVPVVYQSVISNQDGTFTLADQSGTQSELTYLSADQLANYDLVDEDAQPKPKPQRTPLLVRRQKPKKKSRKSKPKVQRLYIALNPVQQQQQQQTQAEAEGQAQGQADIIDAAM